MRSGNVKKFEWKLGRTGILIVIGGMTILLCLAFFLGIRVGKCIDTYPEKIASAPQRFLALFWRPAKQVGIVTKPSVKQPEPDKTGVDLTFHDALTRQKLPSIEQVPVEEKEERKANTDVVAEIIANAPTDPNAEQKIKKEMSSVKKPVESKELVENRKSDVNKKGDDKKGVSKDEGKNASNYVIHVVSLKDQGKASKIQKTVHKMGYVSNVVKVDLKGKGTWYRVIATGFETKAKAQNAANKISKKVKTNCLIRYVGKDVKRKS